MKKSVLFFLTSIFIAQIFNSLAFAAGTQSLAQAWRKAQERVVLLQVQRMDQEAAKLQNQAVGFWEDPVLEFSSGPRDIGTVSSRIQTLSLRQRLPVGPERALDRLAAQGAAELQNLKTVEVEREQENKFVQDIFGFKIAQIELQHAEERMKRIAAIQSHLSKTGAYTASNSLERSLIELRLKEIQQKKASAETRLKLLESHFQDLGVHPQEVQIAWVDAGTLKGCLPSGELRTLSEKQIQALRDTSKQQAEVSRWRPQIDLFAMESREVGGSEEINRAVGVGLSLPLYSGFSPKKTISEKQHLMAEMRLEGTRRQSLLLKESLEKNAELLTRKMQNVTLREIEKLEAGASVFEQALRRGTISILQFLDYEDKVHEQVEAYYAHQMEALNLLGQINLVQEKSLVEMLGVSK